MQGVEKRRRRRATEAAAAADQAAQDKARADARVSGDGGGSPPTPDELAEREARARAATAAARSAEAALAEVALARPATEWDVGDVQAWLAGPMSLAHLGPAFARLEVSGDELRLLTRDDLEFMGVRDAGEQALLLDAIALIVRTGFHGETVASVAADAEAALEGEALAAFLGEDAAPAATPTPSATGGGAAGLTSSTDESAALTALAAALAPEERPAYADESSPEASNAYDRQWRITMAREQGNYAPPGGRVPTAAAGEMLEDKVSPSAEAAALRQHWLATAEQAPDDELDWATFNAEGLSASPLM